MPPDYLHMHIKKLFHLFFIDEDIGYGAFAFGLCEEDVKFASTSSGKSCLIEQMMEYLHAVIIAGKSMFIDNLLYIIYVFILFAANPPSISTNIVNIQ